MAFIFDKEYDDFFVNMNDDNNLLNLDLDLENRYSNNMDPFNFQNYTPFDENYNQIDIFPFEDKKEDFINDDKISEINNNNDFNNQKNKLKEEILFQITKAETSKKDLKGNFLQKKRKQIFKEEESILNEENVKANKEKIFLIYKESKKKSKKGRNKKFQFGGKHNKFSSDNMVRKIKVYLFCVLLRFINASIKQESRNEEQNPEEKNYSKEFLVKVNQELIINIKVDYNLKLLDSKLQNIFSNDISQKVKAFDLDKNKKLIKEIFVQNKLVKTIQILNMTLYQCLEHLRGTKYYKELAGLEEEFDFVINDLKNKGENEKYISQFIQLINTFKEFYNQKTPRKPRRSQLWLE
jgi:hypothetical protein